MLRPSVAITIILAGYAHGAVVVSIFPYTYEVRVSGTTFCMAAKPQGGLEFATCNPSGASNDQRWQLSSDGMLITTTFPYQCLSAWDIDSSRAFLTNCDPSSLHQRWGVSGSALYPMPQLANAALNSCIAPCIGNNAQACTFRPSSLPAGHCRTALGAAYNSFLVGRIAGAREVTSSVTTTTSMVATTAVVTQSTTVVVVDISTTTTSSNPVVTHTKWSTVLAKQPTYTIVVVSPPKINGSTPTVDSLTPVSEGKVTWEGGLDNSVVVVITVAIVSLVVIVVLSSLWFYFSHRAARLTKTNAMWAIDSTDDVVATVPIHRDQPQLETHPTKARTSSLVPSGRTSILLECTHAETEDCIVVVGDRHNLGNWDPQKGLTMTRYPDNPHLFALHIPNVLDDPIEYKFAKISGANNSVTWMSGHNLILQPAAGDITQGYMWEV